LCLYQPLLMLDVQYPPPASHQSLFSPGSSPSGFWASHYWPEPSSKRRNISQDICTSGDRRPHNSSLLAPFVTKVTGTSVEPVVSTIDNMNGSGYAANPAQDQRYALNRSTATARTYFANQTTLPPSIPSPRSIAGLLLTETRFGLEPEEPEFLPVEDVRANNGSNIASYLQLPKSICDTGGSLAQFAAEVCNPSLDSLLKLIHGLRRLHASSGSKVQ